MLFMLFMQFIFIQRGGVGTQFRKGTNVSSEKGNSTSVNQTDNIIITPCLCQRCGAEFGIKIHKGCLLDYNYACPKCGQKVYVKFGSLGCALSLSFHIRLNDLDAFTYPSCSALSLCEQPLFSMFSAINGHSSFLGHTQDSY